jgi:hypothetical protein
MESISFEDRFLNDIYGKTDELYSVLNVPNTEGLNPEMLEGKPKFTPYYVEGVYHEGKVLPTIAVYKTESNYYLYLYKKESSFASYRLKIYYPVRIQKEVFFFINNLKKLNKNGNQ